MRLMAPSKRPEDLLVTCNSPPSRRNFHFTHVRKQCSSQRHFGTMVSVLAQLLAPRTWSETTKGWVYTKPAFARNRRILTVSARDRLAAPEIGQASKIEWRAKSAANLCLFPRCPLRRSTRIIDDAMRLWGLEGVGLHDPKRSLCISRSEVHNSADNRPFL